MTNRLSGANGREIPHYFDDEAEARAMVQAMKDTVPAELADWAQVNERPLSRPDGVSSRHVAAST